jgi:hypothetical protein
MAPICGLHFTDDYIVLAKRDGAAREVNSLSLQPVDTSRDFFGGLDEGLNELMSHELLNKKENVAVSFKSKTTRLFQTELPTGIRDIHEMMSWEFMMRINEAPDDYHFAAIKTGLNRALGVGIKEKELQKYLSLLKKHTLRVHAVDTDVIALFNTFDMNYDTTTPSVLLLFDSTGVTFILVQNKTIFYVSTLASLDRDTIAEDIKRIKKECMAVLRSLKFSRELPWYLSGEILADFSVQDSILRYLSGAKIIDPFIKLPSTVGMDEASLDRFAPLISIAVGLSQRDVL